MKRVFRIICLVLCLLCATSCTDEIDLFEESLGYETFSLRAITTSYVRMPPDNSVQPVNSAMFAILSGEDLYRDTIEIIAHTDEIVGTGVPKAPGEILCAGEPIYIFIDYLKDVNFDTLPISMEYVAHDNKQVSKEYILDFTDPFYKHLDKVHPGP